MKWKTCLHLETFTHRGVLSFSCLPRISIYEPTCLSPVGMPKTTVCKIMLCNKPEVPSNSIRLERLTMTHKIPDTHKKVRSQGESRSPMDAQGSCQLTWQVSYRHQTSFLLGRPWLVSVKVSAPLFQNNLNMNDKAWIQQKLSFIFLWFNIKLTWRKALGYAFKILTSDFFFFITSGCQVWIPSSTEKIYSTKHSTV